MTEPSLQAAKTCELHVHIGGSLFAADLLDLARDHYEKIDWSLFVDSFERAYGRRPDPVALFREALRSQRIDSLKAHCVYGVEDESDFAHFQAKFNLAICIYRHWWNVLGKPEEILHRVFAHHRREGLRYVEYRTMAPYDHTQSEAFVQFHALTARAIAQVCSCGLYRPLPHQPAALGTARMLSTSPTPARRKRGFDPHGRRPRLLSF